MIGNYAGLETGEVVDCSFEMWINQWNILTNRMHDSFSSRSTIPVRVWEIIVCPYDLPHLGQFGR